MKRLGLFAAITFLALPAVSEARLLPLPPPNAAPAPPPQPNAPGATLGGPSKAVTDDIIDAIAEEMNRATTQLQIPGAPKPYHIAYKITEVDVNNVVASLGQTTTRDNNHFVNLEARVRVGTPQLDNSNFVVPQAAEIDAVATITLPLEATPRIARRAAWLVTDAAYKEALIQFRVKMDSRRGGGQVRTDVPSLSPGKPVVSDAPVLVPELETLDMLETRAKQISAVFRGQPDIRDSRCAVTSYLERRWYLTTEGTSVTDTRRASGVLITAASQATDQQPLGDYFLRYGHTASDLPNDKELEGEARSIMSNLALLAKAPALDKTYNGPILFEGEGAVGMVRTSLAPQLGGTPEPIGSDDANVGDLVDSVGTRVFAPSLTIVDDPTASIGAGHGLIGGYRIDDEGTAAQRVQIAKGGMLQALLLGRIPGQKNQISNGHARFPGEGGVFRGSATNLFLSGSGALSRKALEQKLIASLRADKLAFGLIITRFDDAAVTGAPELSRHEQMNLFNSRATLAPLPPPAVLAYKLYPSGKRELVRGVQLDKVDINVWKDNVLGTSKELTAYNFLAANDNQLALRITGGTDDGQVPSGGVESSVVTPDLLLKSIKVRTSTLASRDAPVLPHP